jgi:hypothetical protein
MSIITTLPVELWNIILNYSDSDTAKRFILFTILHNLFNTYELESLKSGYLYDSLILSSSINKIIYKIYNNIYKINNKNRYLNYYSDVYDIVLFQTINIDTTILLKSKLLSKIIDSKQKTKFNNLTNKIINKCAELKNKDYQLMLDKFKC